MSRCKKICDILRLYEFPDRPGKELCVKGCVENGRRTRKLEETKDMAVLDYDKVIEYVDNFGTYNRQDSIDGHLICWKYRYKYYMVNGYKAIYLSEDDLVIKDIIE